MRGLWRSVIFVVCVATSACRSGMKNTPGTGGSAGTNVDAAVNGVSCAPFTACGGNIVGTWRVPAGCGSVSSPACPSSERITAQSSAPQTAYTFAGDGTFTLTASGDLTEALRYPLACLGAITDAGIPQACADFERVFVTPPQTGDAGTQAVEVTSASCAAAANETCACNVVLRYTSAQTSSGSYTTSGNQLTLTVSVSAGGIPVSADSVADYCVSGNTLTLHHFNNSSEWVTTLTR